MPKVAIISDIHANLEALTACIAHIDSQPDVDAIYCLGDICGYGPDPEAVVDIVAERCQFCLMGNHDYALLHAPIGFNPVAAGAIVCQRSMMEPGTFSFPSKKFRWNFVHELAEEKEIGDNFFVHASPRDKIFEYLLPEDATYNPAKLEAVFDMISCRCFVGHTHRPGILTEEPKWYSEKDLGMEYEFRENEKLIINVSSVGQPRDRDPRACYAMLTDEGIVWHRVEYDVETTVSKVRDNQCLDNLCGERLLAGR
ncbi:MAG: metallophosphoesterase family protein [Planctomycetes bacterium]|nr:metallophosphoesterase family protein [Planctomycetota bacterium]